VINSELGAIDISAIDKMRTEMYFLVCITDWRCAPIGDTGYYLFWLLAIGDTTGFRRYDSTANGVAAIIFSFTAV